MPFLKSTTESEYGEWFVYGKDAEEKLVRFKVRSISPGKEHEIERRHTGRKGELRYDRKRDETVLPQDRDADLAAEIDKAVQCLMDSENCQVLPLDQGGADEYAKATGQAVEINKPLSLDGRWSRELKELFLADELHVGRACISAARKIGVKRIEEEEAGKDGSSPF